MVAHAVFWFDLARSYITVSFRQYTARTQQVLCCFFCALCAAKHSSRHWVRVVALISLSFFSQLLFSTNITLIHVVCSLVGCNTSNWGCGAFGGYHDIKSIIQVTPTKCKNKRQKAKGNIPILLTLFTVDGCSSHGQTASLLHLR